MQFRARVTFVTINVGLAQARPNNSKQQEIKYVLNCVWTYVSQKLLEISLRLLLCIAEILRANREELYNAIGRGLR